MDDVFPIECIGVDGAVATFGTLVFCATAPELTGNVVCTGFVVTDGVATNGVATGGMVDGGVGNELIGNIDPVETLATVIR